MACGTSEKMPIEVKREREGERPERPVAHRLADRRPGAARRSARRTRPGAPRSMRRHGSTSSSGMKTALTIENTR